MTVFRTTDGAIVAFTRPVLSEAVLAELEACLDSLERDGGRTPGCSCGAPRVHRGHRGRPQHGL